MVQAIINLGEYEDRVLTVLKGKYGLKNKSDAVNFLIGKYSDDFLEPELRPEYVLKVRDKERNGKFSKYKTLKELKNEIKNA